MINFETTPWVFPGGLGLKLENEFTSVEQNVSGAEIQDFSDFSSLSTCFSNLREGMSRTGTDHIVGTTHVSPTPEGVRPGQVDQGLIVSNTFRDAMQTVSEEDQGISVSQKIYSRDSEGLLQIEKDIGLLGVIDRNEGENKHKCVIQKLVCDGNILKHHDGDTLKDEKILRELCVSDSRNNNFTDRYHNVTVLKADDQKHVTQELVLQREATSLEKGDVKHDNSFHGQQQMHATQELASQWNRNLSDQGNLKQENSFNVEIMPENNSENEEPLKEHKDLAIFYFEDPPAQQCDELRNRVSDWIRPTHVDSAQPVSTRGELQPNFFPWRNAIPCSQNFSSGATQSTCGLMSCPPDPHETFQSLHNEFSRLPFLNKDSHNKYSWFANTERAMGERAPISNFGIFPRLQQYSWGYRPPGKAQQIVSQTNNHSDSNNDVSPIFQRPQQSLRGNTFSGEIPQIHPQTNNYSTFSDYRNPFSPRSYQSSQRDRFTDENPQISHQTDSSSNDNSPSEASIQSSSHVNDESSSRVSEDSLSQANGESSFRATDKISSQTNGKSLPQVNDGHLLSMVKAKTSIIKEEKTSLQKRSEMNNPYERQFCPTQTNSRTNLETHAQKHANEVNGNAVTEEKLNNAEESFRKSKPFNCPFCPMRVKSKSSLDRHVLRHTSEKQVTCPHCPFKCYDTTGLNSHMLSHSDERPFACPRCAKTWKRKAAMERHVRCAHSDARPFSCGICSATYKDRRDLRRHILTHATERPYSCPQCPATFKTPDSRKHHMKTHSSEKPFICAHCQARFSQKHHLRIHSKVHMSEKPYSCEHCPARFRWQGGLSQHMATHGERKLECAHCSARFRHKNNLRAHMKIHTGEKPHACTKCPARFREIATLKNHLQAHFNEKKFTCAHCEEGFRYKGRLQKHLETQCDKRPGVKRITLRLTDDIKLTCVL